jgi:hypothetical protein
MLTKEYRTKKTENRFFNIVVYSLFSILFSQKGYSQCAMCRASLESSGETTQAQAVNDGIVYLMAIPYILVGIVALYIYRMYSKKKKV